MFMSQLLIFIPAAIAIACIPGANNLLSFQNGMNWGVKAAIQAVFGRCVAYTVIILLVVAGLGQLLETSEFAFQCIKWMGVIYLVWIGISMFRTTPIQVKSQIKQSMGKNSGEKATHWSLIIREFIVAMANPKAILLFSALLPQFVVPSQTTSYMIQLLMLGGLYTVIEWITASIYACLGQVVTSGSPSIKRLLIVQRISGSLMMCMSVLLACSKKSN